MKTVGAVHRYEALDGLRGVAALTVMFGHFGLLLDLFWVHNGLLAVDTFFVMSGFVIAHSYGERLGRGMPAWAYLYRRVVRLYPMYVIALLIGAVVICYGTYTGAMEYQMADVLRSVALNVLYIPFLNAAPIHFEVGQVFPADPPAWSLFFEMLASGAFLLLFGLRLRILLLVSALCYVALIAAGLHYATGGEWIDIHNGFYTSNLLGGLPRVGFGFSLGVLLHAVTRLGTAGWRIQALVGRIPYPSFLLYAAALAMFLFPRTAHGIYPLVAVATVVPAIVFFGAHICLRSELEKNVATFLGWISYPIYCLHYPIVRLAIFLRGSEHGSGYLLMAVSAAVTLALAVALTRWYEEPLRAALSGRLFAPSRLQVSKVN
jgi:peptidoglycan/LPS O-acetylase OafA/YrhL